MVLMRVGEHDAANVGDRKSGALQSGAQSCNGCFGLWTSVDDRDWIFGDQIDIDRADVEGRRERDGDDFHSVIADFRLPIADLNLIAGGCSPVPNGHELLLERENQDLKDHGSLF
jgi:hypothetical protein